MAGRRGLLGAATPRRRGGEAARGSSGRAQGHGRPRGHGRGRILRGTSTTRTNRTVTTPALTYSAMTEANPCVLEYQHDKSKPREAEALLMLRKVASLVKPVMRNRGWKIHRLCEFHAPRLLGLNQHYGSNIQIFLRLRHHGDHSQFLPLDQVTDTMLHELAHIVIGPHNAQFNALWNQLRDELTELVMKGYSGEGFLSRGYRLGGGLGRVPEHEAARRRSAAAAATRRRQQAAGRRLGGTPLPPGVDMREVIAGAVERRLAITQGCASGTAEGDQAARDALQSGVTTQAGDFMVNGGDTSGSVAESADKASAEALLEIMTTNDSQHAETRTGGPSLDMPVLSHNRTGTLDDFVRRSITPKFENVYDSRGASGAVNSSVTADRTDVIDLTCDVKTASATTVEDPGHWSCAACTLRNPTSFLACDACGAERPSHSPLAVSADQTALPTRNATSEPPSGLGIPPAAAVVPSIQEASDQSHKRSASVTSAASAPSHAPSRKRREATDKPELSIQKRALQSLKKVEDSLSSRPMGWLCPYCNTFMEKQWWTCVNCGTIKSTS